MLPTRLLLCVTSAALCVSIAACGGSPSSPAPTAPSPSPAPAPAPPVATTTEEYEGVFASGTFTGTLTMSAAVPVSSTASQPAGVQPRAIANATGTAKFSGAGQSNISLSGTYDTATAAFSLRGGSFVVNATVQGQGAVGTITTAPGAGTVGAVRKIPGVTPIKYCGNYRGTESGKFVFAVGGRPPSAPNFLSVFGVAAEDGSRDSISLRGSVAPNVGGLSDDTIEIEWSFDGTGRGSARGTIRPTSANGTWENSDGQLGTWSASVCP